MGLEVIGIIGAILGILTAVVSLMAVVRNNAKWSGIVDTRLCNMQQTIDRLDKGLYKLDEDKGEVWKELTHIISTLDGQEKSLGRLHSRVDTIDDSGKRRRR